jgi:hypothetical protein
MEEFLTDERNYVYILLAFFALWFFAQRIKYRKIDRITSRLNAKRNGNQILGEKDRVAYMIAFEEGYSGGSATGPGTVGHKSIVRIIVEKETDYCFELDGPNIEGLSEDLKNKIGTENLIKLFEFGFNKFTSNGKSVEISISPATLGKDVGSEMLEDAVSNLVKITSAL